MPNRTTYAQFQSNGASRWSSDALIERYQRGTLKAHQLAKRNGWPIRKKYSNGQLFSLQEIDPLGHPIYYRTHNATASMLLQTATLYSGGSMGLALSGSSAQLASRLGLWDGGRALTTHREFVSPTPRIQHMDETKQLSDHTTHVAGTLIAQGTNPAARGMAFGAGLRIWDFDNDVAEIATTAKDLLLSNHAYGPVAGWVFNADRPGNDPTLKWEWWGNTAMSTTEDYQFGFYGSKTADLDRILYNNPYYLMVRSADNKHAETGPPANTSYFLRNTNEKSTLARSRNDSYDVIAAEATAKNALTVGAADVSTDRSRINVSSYSGWGPTDDGRIKPDLLGIGTPIFSALSSDTDAYGNLLGTSMASATVTGSLLLLQELYSRLKNGQFMRSATLKALAIHTATRPTTTTLAVAPPNYQQGWGLLNMRAAAGVIQNDSRAHQLSEHSLLQGREFTQTITAQGNEPLLVTIAWTDPEATATTIIPRNVNNRTPKLVNDLDLRLIDETGAATGPWVLNPDRPAEPATTGDNVRDNIEQVVIQRPVPGQTYTIRISHKGQLRYGAQPFSLVVSGLRRSTCSLSVSLLSTADTVLCSDKILSLSAGPTRLANSQIAPNSLQYQWLQNGFPLSGATKSTLNVTQAGSYVVRITDQNGCTGLSKSITIRAGLAPFALTPATSQLICANRPSVQLSTRSEPGASYEWLRDGDVISRGNSASYVAADVGSYAVRVSYGGCQVQSPAVVVELALTLFTEIQPADPEIFLPRQSSVRLQVTPNLAYSYQWLRNNEAIPRATDHRYFATQPGQYSLRISQQECTAKLSPRTIYWANDVPTTSIADSLLSSSPADSTLTVMPNPAFEQVAIRYSYQTATHPSAVIYSLTGAVVIPETPMLRKDNYFEAIIPVRSFPPGVYLVRVFDGPQIKTSRFVKR